MEVKRKELTNGIEETLRDDVEMHEDEVEWYPRQDKEKTEERFSGSFVERRYYQVNGSQLDKNGD